jgi:hypothetical protein
MRRQVQVHGDLQHHLPHALGHLSARHGGQRWRLWRRRAERVVPEHSQGVCQWRHSRQAVVLQLREHLARKRAPAGRQLLQQLRLLLDELLHGLQAGRQQLTAVALLQAVLCLAPQLAHDINERRQQALLQHLRRKRRLQRRHLARQLLPAFLQALDAHRDGPVARHWPVLALAESAAAPSAAAPRGARSRCTRATTPLVLL